MELLYYRCNRKCHTGNLSLTYVLLNFFHKNSQIVFIINLVAFISTKVSLSILKS